MKFIVVLIGLLLQLFIRPERINKQGAINHYLEAVQPLLVKFQMQEGWKVLVGLLAPAVILLSLLHLLFHHSLILYFIYSLFILWFCLDFRDLKVELTDYFTAFANENLVRAQVEAEQFTMKALGQNKEEITRAVTERLFAQSLTQIFSIIFWFMLLGPFGAAVYFIVATISEKAQKNDLGLYDLLMVEYVKGILDWVPVRLVAFTFALISHFAPIMNIWLEHLGSGVAENSLLLVESGLSALNCDSPDVHSNVMENHQAIKLIARAVWTWVIVIGVFTLLSLF